VRNLLRQRVGIGKPHLATQPSDETDLDPLSIQIGVEIEYMHFEAAFMDLEGRVEAQIGDARTLDAVHACAHGIHAVRRQDESRDPQIGRREPERFAAMMAVDHAPARARCAAEQRPRTVEIAGADGTAYRAATDEDAVDLDRTDHLHREAALGTQSRQGLRPAGPPVAERDAMPDDDGVHTQAGNQQAAHEVVGRHRRKCTRETLHDDGVDASGGNPFDSGPPVRDQLRG